VYRRWTKAGVHFRRRKKKTFYEKREKGKVKWVGGILVGGKQKTGRAVRRGVIWGIHGG